MLGQYNLAALNGNSVCWGNIIKSAYWDICGVTAE